MNIIDFAPPQVSITPRLTAQDFLALDPDSLLRRELIEGEIIDLASPTATHQFVLGKLYRYVDAFVTDSALGQVYPAPLDIILSSQDVVQPDVVYIATANPNCQLGDEDKWVGVPDLCVEILSSNVRHDRLTKRALYEQFGVKEYWIVDPVGRYIEIHSLQENKLVLVALYQDGDTLESPLLPSLKIDLNQVFPKG